MDNEVKAYLESLLPERSAYFQKLEQFAREHRVPIMEQTGIEAMLQMMRIQEPKRILEIGTAIGYSALRMAEALPEATITTIEIDEERVEQALANVKLAGMEERITVLKGDALDLYHDTEKLGPYDAIFIDAAKGQYIKFFEMYSQLLTKKGCIYTDNVLFKGLVAKGNVESKRLKSLVEKLKTYNQWLMSNSNFNTTIFQVGDGLAVSRKK